MMLLIGSRALSLVRPECISRIPRDFDFICTQEEFKRWYHTNDHYDIQMTGDHVVARAKDTIVEFEITTADDPVYQLGTRDGTATRVYNVAPFNLLYLLKTSHRYLKGSPHFWKTAFDWHVMRDAGAVIPDNYKDALAARERKTYARQNHPKLNTNKDTFFAENQGVKYTYDHDSIHRAVAWSGVPAYTAFQADGAEVRCTQAKFDSLPYETRLNSVIEESCVLAIERSLVPFPGVKTPKQAYMFALSKVCSSISSGWWRRFAYEHVFDAVKAYPADYYTRFTDGLTNGVVRAVG